jgi:hypothetical protein
MEGLLRHCSGNSKRQGIRRDERPIGARIRWRGCDHRATILTVYTQNLHKILFSLRGLTLLE